VASDPSNLIRVLPAKGWNGLRPIFLERTRISTRAQAHDRRMQLPGEDQRQHRQFRRYLVGLLDVRAEVLFDADQPGVRDYAARLNDKDAGMTEMRDRFRDMGGRLYVDADAIAQEEGARKAADPAAT
jgi:hypothetical protein